VVDYYLLIVPYKLNLAQTDFCVVTVIYLYDTYKHYGNKRCYIILIFYLLLYILL